jgi:hypothetical protein
MKIFEGSQSQAGQESFVLNALNEKREGYYVEIGSFESYVTNNTYLLETQYDWKGVGLEILPDPCSNYNANRKNLCLNVNAVTFDYQSYFDKNNFPMQIDYLQVDIDPPLNTLAALVKVLQSNRRFSVITFEHDLYVKKENQAVKDIQKYILSQLGYSLVVENAKHDWREFEDWWVDPKVIPLPLQFQ